MKTKVSFIISLVLFLSLSGILLGLLILWLFYLESYSYILENFFYLWLLAALFYIAWRFKVSSGKILLYFLILYFIGAFLVLLKLSGVAEIVMRATLVGWIFGVGKALIEYRRSPT